MDENTITCIVVFTKWMCGVVWCEIGSACTIEGETCERNTYSVRGEERKGRQGGNINKPFRCACERCVCLDFLSPVLSCRAAANCVMCGVRLINVSVIKEERDRQVGREAGIIYKVSETLFLPPSPSYSSPSVHTFRL